MKIQNTEMEFVTFDAQDVITTSSTPKGPLAYATGYALYVGEGWYHDDEMPTYEEAVDALDYQGCDEVSLALGGPANFSKYFEITNVAKSGEGYGVKFNTNPNDAASESQYGSFDNSEALHAWLEGYFNNYQ